jgi:redox-sensitive bicupin YhaK (pirin superfamily)
MLHVRRSTDRGHADHGWLDTYHTFSFADYHDPDFLGFSSLRVLNQDRVAPGHGFPRHGHRDMEIVSLVLDGALAHQDSLGNGSTMRPGEVQLMSAGTGVSHSEFNASKTEPLHFLQMWILPADVGRPPRYEQRAFAEDERRGKLRLVVAPEGADAAEGALTIGQDARLHVGLLHGSERIAHALTDGRAGWLHVARGRLRANGQELGPGDGAAIVDERMLVLEDGAGAELVLWELEGL